MSSELKTRLQDEMKAAMKGGEKDKLAVIRLINAAIKQVEVDERIELDDERVITVMDKMLKQRRESIAQYEKAGRDDLVAVEAAEINVIQTYMPQALNEDEIAAIIDDAISKTGAASIKDMGKVMGIIKPLMAGRADMGKVSGTIKSRLGA